MLGQGTTLTLELEYAYQSNQLGYATLRPGPANTRRPAKIWRGRPGPVLGPVPGLVEALVYLYINLP